MNFRRVGILSLFAITLFGQTSSGRGDPGSSASHHPPPRRSVSCNSLIRVETKGGETFQGKLYRIDKDSLVLWDGETILKGLSISDVSQVSAGQNHGILGASLGLAAGVLFYLWWKSSLDPPSPWRRDDSTPPLLYVAPLVSCAVGFVEGRRHKRWSPTNIQYVSPCGRRPATTTVSLRLTFAFGP